jgi:hypothetical protein
VEFEGESVHSHFEQDVAMPSFTRRFSRQQRSWDSRIRIRRAILISQQRQTRIIQVGYVKIDTEIKE